MIPFDDRAPARARRKRGPCPDSLVIKAPAWMVAVARGAHPCPTDEEKMDLVLALARENVRRNRGGPFAAAVFEQSSGKVVGAGVNLVVPEKNSVLHAEVVAIMLAEKAVGSFHLRGGRRRYELVSSCAPCAMCLGAVLWSGVARLVYGAATQDARRIGFDEGPVFPQSLAYLRKAGMTITPHVRRREACEILLAYQRQGGLIYNG